MESESEEVHELRRCLRDVVALGSLPALWMTADARQIANDLADAVYHTLRLDVAFLFLQRVHDIEILRVRDERDTDLLPRIRVTVANRPGDTVIHLRAGDALQLSSHCLSAEHPEDCLVAGSYRSDFPTDSERLLLRVACNEAGKWLARQEAEAALAAEFRFRNAIEESMLAGVAAIDLAGRQTYVNRAFAEMVGWPAETLIGSATPFVYWAPEERDSIADAFGRVLAGTSVGANELVFLRGNGERFDALVLASLLRNEAEETTGCVMSVYDITQRKWEERYAAFLAQVGEILGRSLDDRTTLEAISTLVVRRIADWCFVDLIEPDGTFERTAVAHANPTEGALARAMLRRTSGASSPASLGASVLLNDIDVALSFLQPLTHDEKDRQALRALPPASFLSVPLRARDSAFGALRIVRTDGVRLFGPRELSLAEELARRVSLAVDNARLYAAARDANRAKDEFLAHLSHELRTPITATLGWLQLLQLGSMAENDRTNILKTIEQSTRAQAKLIDDLLDVSRIISGKLQLDSALIPLSDVVSAALDIVRPAASAKRQNIELDLRSRGALVLGDSSRLQQVFWNLLSNAVKFTPSGGSIHIAATTEGERTAMVIVSDSGQGISSELLPVIFDRFRQARHAAKLGGLGLGLAIAKDIVELHGGSITATSPGLNRGSTFTVTLPLALERGVQDDRPSAEVTQ
jgi:PAS domain S-box-containing protein